MKTSRQSKQSHGLPFWRRPRPFDPLESRHGRFRNSDLLPTSVPRPRGPLIKTSQAYATQSIPHSPIMRKITGSLGETAARSIFIWTGDTLVLLDDEGNRLGDAYSLSPLQ